MDNIFDRREGLHDHFRHHRPRGVSRGEDEDSRGAPKKRFNLEWASPDALIFGQRDPTFFTDTIDPNLVHYVFGKLIIQKDDLLSDFPKRVGNVDRPDGTVHEENQALRGPLVEVADNLLDPLLRLAIIGRKTLRRLAAAKAIQDRIDRDPTLLQGGASEGDPWIDDDESRLRLLAAGAAKKWIEPDCVSVLPLDSLKEGSENPLDGKLSVAGDVDEFLVVFEKKIDPVRLEPVFRQRMLGAELFLKVFDRLSRLWERNLVSTTEGLKNVGLDKVRK